MAYSQSLAATGGTQPYHWQLTFGTLPAGLSLNASTGLISGTPTAPASATPLTFLVSDSSSPVLSATTSLNLTITPASLTITTTSLPNGTVNTAYSQTLAATGGTGAYTWTLTSGTLPAGLSLNASSGLISGTPTAIVSATPAHLQGHRFRFASADRDRKFHVNDCSATLTITTTSLPNGVVGTAYSTTLAATGGTTPIFLATHGGNAPERPHTQCDNGTNQRYAHRDRERDSADL